MGYRPHTALADLVDNSITAGATNVQIELSPTDGDRPGWIRIQDDGRGMNHDELRKAMRWGGDGPLTTRDPKDLGRFGLGLKTASFSMGERLTLVSKNNGSINAIRWDLEKVCETGKWLPIEGVDNGDLLHLEGTIYDPACDQPSGTVVLITHVDKLRIDARSREAKEKNKSALIETTIGHLRLVFHRFLEKKALKLSFGAAQLKPWNLFGRTGDSEEPTWLKHQEKLSDARVGIRTFVIPHHKNLTPEEHIILGGPCGWNAHQGFFIYRANRLIVAGGWLGFSKPEEHCKLARIAVDLPNDIDESWGLDVIKSKIAPPAILLADIERIARAARSEAMKRYGFHGEKEAPKTSRASDSEGVKAFWQQLSVNDNVIFRINRGHPLVEALVQNLSSIDKADAFIHAFERLLPVAAIMQQPAKTTHGLITEPNDKELNDLLHALHIVIEWFVQTGKSKEEAERIAFLSQPFANLSETLKKRYNQHPTLT